MFVRMCVKLWFSAIRHTTSLTSEMSYLQKHETYKIQLGNSILTKFTTNLYFMGNLYYFEKL